MNYYLYLQRQSEGYAARVFEELYADDATRRAAATFLADAVRHAGRVSPSWTITLDPNSVRLNVGPARLLSLWNNQLWFTTTEHAPIRSPSWLRDVSAGAMVYKSVGIRSRQYSVEASRIPHLPAPVREAALNYVEAAAGKRRGSSWRRAHSQGVVLFLESYLRTPLPAQPVEQRAGYLTDPLDERADASALTEGALIRVSRNVFERNPEVRAACLKHYGARCFVCGLSLGELYGEVADDVIHVHHLVPLSEIRKSYNVDPVRDLRPLCPNCHTVVHLQNPPLEPAVLRERLQR